MSDKKPFPEHVAVILDGNGRWAKERGRERTYGHQVGAANVKTIVRAAGESADALCIFHRELEASAYRSPFSDEAFQELPDQSVA